MFYLQIMAIFPKIEHGLEMFIEKNPDWQLLGKQEDLERQQRRGARIVLNTTHLSNEEMVKYLGWNTLSKRREKHIKLVQKCQPL